MKKQAKLQLLQEILDIAKIKLRLKNETITNTYLTNIYKNYVVKGILSSEDFSNILNQLNDYKQDLLLQSQILKDAKKQEYIEDLKSNYIAKIDLYNKKYVCFYDDERKF